MLTENVVKYWRSSLADGELLSADRWKKRVRIAKIDWTTGEIDDDAADQISNALKSFKEGDGSCLVLAPFSASSVSSHGIRSNGVSIVPLLIPVDMRGGKLIPHPEYDPWIPRKYLDPSEYSECVFGSIESYDAFFNTHTPPVGEDRVFSSIVSHAQSMSAATLNNDGFPLTKTLKERGYKTSTQPTIYIGQMVKGASANLISLCDYLTTSKAGFDSKTAPLLTSFASLDLIPQRSFLSDYEIAKASMHHCGEMMGKHPLSPSQREVMSHYSELNKGELLAVNGPPGTGKTTVLQSLIATEWVLAAIHKKKPPFIVATSANNQAVTNIISSFTGQFPDRWLPDIDGFGIYFPSDAAKKRDSSKEFLISSTNPGSSGDDLFSRTVNRKYIALATKEYMSRCAVISLQINSVDDALIYFHKQLTRAYKKHKKTIGIATMYQNTSSKLLRSIIKLRFIFAGFDSDIRKAKVDFRSDDSLLHLLDTTARHEMFAFAVHYWEAMWIKKATTFVHNQRHVRKRDKLETLAMLAPCFVATAYMLPKIFQGPMDDNNRPTYWLNEASLLILDEAGQMPPEIAGALMALAKKAVVVGDTKQIEPVWSVQKATDHGNLKKFKLDDAIDNDSCGIKASSDSSMVCGQKASVYSKNNRERGLLLTEHRRCLPQIIGYCNELAYAGALESKRTDDGIYNHSGEYLYQPMWSIQCDGIGKKTNGSWINEIEAQSIVDWVCANKEGVSCGNAENIGKYIAVITPFTAQAKLIKQKLCRVFGANHTITVGTVHALQGGERHLVIFSPVYSIDCGANQYFFDRGVNMLNVAVSRAKNSFMVYGDMKIFTNENEDLPSSLLGKHLAARTNPT